MPAVDSVRFPLNCSECNAPAGMPFKVETMPNAAVCVALRCTSCGHEWELEMPGAASPLVQAKADRRKHPR
jgi:hypothetical protein